VATVGALGVYLGGVVPIVRRELGRWRGDAGSIPDPLLRGHALAALEEKALNVEATAVFAILAPRSTRPTAIRAMAALQVAIDYLDTLSEQPSPEPLRNGLQLHRALAAALTPGLEGEDWYRLHAQREDGGYLDRLVAACQEGVRSLPSQDAVAPLAQRAARRCGEGQSHTHATEPNAGQDGTNATPSQGAGRSVGHRALKAWALRQPAPPVYRWWEVAAGASSSVAAHALIAAAADPKTTVAEAELIDAAYFPSIGALTVLLDDLIDRDEDAAGGAHNYMAYYSSGEEAANRLELIAHLAHSGLARLRHPHRHAAILAGVAGFYLSAAEAETPYARPTRKRLLDSVGLTLRPIVAVMRRRHRARKRPGGQGAPPDLERLR
jgi:tetraprenyl-beta-curcumene synthase